MAFLTNHPKLDLRMLAKNVEKKNEANLNYCVFKTLLIFQILLYKSFSIKKTGDRFLITNYIN